MEDLNEDGTILTTERDVLERWRTDFENLYNCSSGDDFDNDHFNFVKLEKHSREHHMESQDRLCKRCSNNCVEDEIHFSLHCSLYTDFRTKMFYSTGCNFMPQSSDRDILCILISDHPRKTAKYS